MQECGLHTLIHTFPFETKLQYRGLNKENAESLAPLFFVENGSFLYLRAIFMYLHLLLGAKGTLLA
jgi:hypothetical protein